MGMLLVGAGAMAAGFGVVGTRVAIPAPPRALLPIDLILQLARGPDLLGVVILTRLILR
jgi:hypothetical protein